MQNIKTDMILEHKFKKNALHHTKLDIIYFISCMRNLFLRYGKTRAHYLLKNVCFKNLNELAFLVFKHEFKMVLRSTLILFFLEIHNSIVSWRYFSWRKISKNV